MFEKYGQIINVQLLKDKETGLPIGEGYVYFTKIGPAQQAIDKMNG